MTYITGVVFKSEVVNDHEWMSCAKPVIEAPDRPNLTLLGSTVFKSTIFKSTIF
ncbi:hypothetical protein MTR_3g027275 [Medicago truncatula]|uniref:Uncharacterized protein n=1 Tax=Medicago truncatula TaxID=3880 RepID=A0A072UVU9_MEDTR|nr:hypothetical protein MTR_3g027275 [Medicago truncatula]